MYGRGPSQVLAHVLMCGVLNVHEPCGCHMQIATDGSLSDHKVVAIGVKPLSLSAFTMAGVPYVFAATDRPAVVYARNGKLIYSPVNEQDVTMLCSFSTDAFPGAIAMAKDDCLMITQIDAIQKLHIRCAACASPFVVCPSVLRRST